MTTQSEHKARTSQWTTASWIFALSSFMSCVLLVVLGLGGYLTRDMVFRYLAIFVVSPFCGIIAWHIASYRIRRSSGLRPNRAALFLNYFFAVPTMWLVVGLAWYWTTQSLWVAHATKELDQRGAPPACLVQSLESNQWVSEASKFFVFSNGWASYAYSTMHESSAIGDVALLRTSDGAVYICHYHFCSGPGYLYCLSETRPKDFDELLKLCETEERMPKLRWKKIRDATACAPANGTSPRR